MTSEVTQAALEPCPLCGDSMKTDNAGTFGHTDSNAKCLLARQAWALMPSYVDAWNTRFTAQSGEGRSGAGEDALLEALDAAHFYIDASPDELADRGITRDGALRIARDKRAALNARQSGEGERGQ